MVATIGSWKNAGYAYGFTNLEPARYHGTGNGCQLVRRHEARLECSFALKSHDYAVGTTFDFNKHNLNCALYTEHFLREDGPTRASMLQQAEVQH